MSSISSSKKVQTEVSKECWIALKIVALQKDISLQKVITDILERSMSKKINITNNNEEK